jgi:hypothetical protein
MYCAHASLQRVAAKQLGVSDEEMDARLSSLGALLPGGLAHRLARASPAMVARLASNTRQV